MRQAVLVKLILFVFFLFFFGFLFWYFYNPEEVILDNKNTKNQVDLFPSGGSGVWGKTKEFFGLGNNTESSSGGEIKVENGGDKEGEKEDTDDNNKDIKAEVKKMPILRQLTNFPTGGAIIERISDDEFGENIINNERFRKLPDGEYSEIRAINMKNNHIFASYDFIKEIERISNKTTLKTFNVNFFDKEKFVFQYFTNKNLKTYLATLKKEIVDSDLELDEEDGIKKSKYNLTGFFLDDDNILSYTINKKTQKIFYLKDGDLGVEGYIVDANGINKRKVFEHDFREWNVHWSEANKIILSTKASSKAKSLAFELDLNTGTYKKLLYSVQAGNVLPSSLGNVFLYSGIISGRYKTFLIRKSDRFRQILNFKTPVEKCVWNDNGYVFYCAVPEFIRSDDLDDWYKGKKYFVDSVYKFNIKNGESEIIFSPKDEKELFDMVDIHLDDRNRYLYFKDKKTDFYWSLDLKQIQEEKERKLEEEKKLENKFKPETI